MYKKSVETVCARRPTWFPTRHNFRRFCGLISPPPAPLFSSDRAKDRLSNKLIHNSKGFWKGSRNNWIELEARPEKIKSTPSFYKATFRIHAETRTNIKCIHTTYVINAHTPTHAYVYMYMCVYIVYIIEYFRQRDAPGEKGGQRARPRGRSGSELKVKNNIVLLRERTEFREKCTGKRSPSDIYTRKSEREKQRPRTIFFCRTSTRKRFGFKTEIAFKKQIENTQISRNRWINYAVTNRLDSVFFFFNSLNIRNRR